MSPTSMFTKIATASALALNFAATDADAQSLQERLNAMKKTENVELGVACGVPDKANCNVIVPEISQKLPSTVRLRPEETTGSNMSGQAVCANLVPAAVGQADTFKSLLRTPECAGTFEPVGKPMYPYYGFMIVRADRDYDTFSKMIDQRNGKALKIAAGSEGSGGHDTLQAIKDYAPKFANAISRENGGGQTALDRVTDGALDAFFVMDAPDSKFIDDIKSKVDEKGKNLFKIIAMDLPSGFYNNDKNTFGEYQLYTEESFKIPGWWFSTDTISVGAVTIVNKEFREASDTNGKATSALRQATIDSTATIRDLTKTPEDWAPRLAR